MGLVINSHVMANSWCVPVLQPLVILLFKDVIPGSKFETVSKFVSSVMYFGDISHFAVQKLVGHFRVS